MSIFSAQIGNALFAPFSGGPFYIAVSPSALGSEFAQSSPPDLHPFGIGSGDFYSSTYGHGFPFAFDGLPQSVTIPRFFAGSATPPPPGGLGGADIPPPSGGEGGESGGGPRDPEGEGRTVMMFGGEASGPAHTRLLFGGRARPPGRSGRIERGQGPTERMGTSDIDDLVDRAERFDPMGEDMADARSVLNALARSHPEWRVRSHAADCLKTLTSRQRYAIGRARPRGELDIDRTWQMMEAAVSRGRFDLVFEYAMAIILTRDKRYFFRLLDHDHPAVRTAAYNYLLERRCHDYVQKAWAARERYAVRRSLEGADPSGRRYAIRLLGVVAPAVMGEAELLLKDLEGRGDDEATQDEARRTIADLHRNLIARQRVSLREDGRLDFDFLVPDIVAYLSARYQMQVAAQAVLEVEAAARKFYDELRVPKRDDPAELAKIYESSCARIDRILNLRTASVRDGVRRAYDALFDALELFVLEYREAPDRAARGELAFADAARLMKDPGELTHNHVYGYKVSPARKNAADLILGWLEKNTRRKKRLGDGWLFEGPPIPQQVDMDGFGVSAWPPPIDLNDDFTFGPVLGLFGWRVIVGGGVGGIMAKILFGDDLEESKKRDIETRRTGRYAAASIIGQRDEHQDSYSTWEAGLPGGPLFIETVADGHGFGGGLASRIAAENFPKELSSILEKSPQVSVRDAIATAASKVERMIAESILHGGTTLVASVQFRDKVYIVNIGDSRGYVVTRDNAILQATKDHVWPGGEVRYNMALTRALGDVNEKAASSGEITAQADVFEFDTSEIKSVLLCTDGLYNYVDEINIGPLVIEKSPEDAVFYLIKAARDSEDFWDPAGGDNATALVVSIGKKDRS